MANAKSILGVSIKNVTRHRLTVPRDTFSKIAKDVLPGWDISLVFVGAKRAQMLNENLRGKTYVPNVLSYKVGTKSGEIIICPSEAAKQAPDFKMVPDTYFLYLFIHGLLHIKGRAHSVTMEKCEQELLSRYVTKNSNRHRHRDVPDKDSCRRRTRR